jgi:CBS domain containing-hemolysin-like protein
MSQEPRQPPWWRRAVRVGALSFVLAGMVNYLGDLTLQRAPAVLAVLVVLVLIGIGIAFDILGTAVTAADQVPLNAMASKKVPGARQALWLVRNADRVANFANDVVGDVTGAVSGAAGGTVALQLSEALQGGAALDQLISLAVIGAIAGLTVGGKAAGKTLALTRATDVVVQAGRVLYAVERITGRSWTGGQKSNASQRRTR